MPSDFVNPTTPSKGQNFNVAGDPFPSNPSTYSGNNVESKKNSCNNPLWGPIVLAAAFLFFSTGVSLVPIGLVQQNKANNLDSETDFTLIGSACTITESIFIKTEQKTCDKGRKCGCNDWFQYTFTASQLAEEDNFYAGRIDYEFKSRDHYISRGVDNCNNTPQSEPLWEEGSVVRCWRPAEPGGDLPKQYRCGNEDCIKVLNPQDDVDRAQGIAKAFWISGTVLLGVAIPVTILGIVLCLKKSRVK